MSDARRRLLEHVLARVVEGDPSGAADAASEDLAMDPAWAGGLLSFAAFMAQDFTRATEAADAALAAAHPHDPLGLGLARAARALATAGTDDRLPGGEDPLADLAAVLPAGDGQPEAFVRYLAAEAALACARLDLADRIVTASGPLALAGAFAVIEKVMRVRLLAFRGRIAEAAELLATVSSPGVPLLGLLVDATELLVRGNAAERARARALADRIDAATEGVTGYLGSGCSLLAAFGLVAVGDVQRSARMALAAGRDASLSGYTVIDRALCFELLVAAAVIEDDLDAAEAWAQRAAELSGSAIAGSTVDRLAARLALQQDRPAEAVELADRAVASARAEGRIVEVAEGEIVAARARIAASSPGEAATRLESMVASADPAGHSAARRAAARELRAIGRRLRPSAGSEWDGLSERERDVALLIAEGRSNREIAGSLHLSEHTVRSHVARVLAAFGAASRSLVAVRLAEVLPPAPIPDAPLTPRQSEVVALIAEGAGNARIAEELGMSVKTVESYVSEILRRWDLPSRVAIVRAAQARSSAE